MRDKDLGEVAGDVSDFARRNPLAFLGGAALLGFAGTRIARASERHREGSVDLNHMWDSDEGDDELEAAVVGRQPHTPPAAPSPATSSPATAGTAPATGAGVPHGKPGEIK